MGDPKKIVREKYHGNISSFNQKTKNECEDKFISRKKLFLLYIGKLLPYEFK